VFFVQEAEMKTVLCGLALFASFASQASATTLEQSKVGGALETLKFKFVDPTDGEAGGDHQYVVTEKTIAAIKGRTFGVEADGSVIPARPDGAGAGATEDQALIGAALEDLKFKFVQPADGRVGGPQQYQVTAATLKFLTKGKRFWVKADGSVTFTKSGAGAAGDK